MPAMPADIDECSQPVFAAHDDDRQLSPCQAGKIIAYLSYLRRPSHILQVVSEDTLAFQVHKRLIGIPGGWQREPVVEVAGQFGDFRLSRRSLFHDWSPSSERV